MKTTKIVLIAILILAPIVLIIRIFEYMNNPYPFFSFENASLTILIIGILVVIISLIQLKKHEKKSLG